MNLTIKLKACLIAGAFLAQPLYADVFQNLDFEDAVIVPLGGLPEVDQSLALPFWETSDNVEFFIYNTVCIGSICTSIHDHESIVFQPLQGNYSIHLDPGALGLGGGQVNSILQSGTVPPTATSLTLLVDSADPDFFQVTFNGTPLTLLSDFSDGDQREFYDISPFAGSTGTLTIGQIDPDGFGTGALIDDIQFVVVPEPSSTLLGILVCVGAMFRIKR